MNNIKISKTRWEIYYKVQRSGKRNMFGYDWDIQRNYDDIMEHFLVHKKTEDWVKQ